MLDSTKPVLSLPVCEITNRYSPNVCHDHIHARDVAGPFFDAGGNMICLAQLPEYNGGLYRPDTHIFSLIVQGRMEFRMGKDTYIAESGDLVCTPVGTLTQRTALEPVEWLYIYLEDVPMWAPLKQQGCAIRQYESADLMYILATRIIEALRNLDIYSIRCARESAEMLVKLLERELRQSTNERQSRRMDRMVDLVEQIRKNPRYEWNRTSMAQEADMSERNLTRTFRRTFGVPPGKMVTKIRMEIAAQMLHETTGSVKAIAASLGYRTSFAFSRVFKNYTGVAPGKFRKNRRSGADITDSPPPFSPFKIGS